MTFIAVMFAFVIITGMVGIINANGVVSLVVVATGIVCIPAKNASIYIVMVAASRKNKQKLLRSYAQSKMIELSTEKPPFSLILMIVIRRNKRYENQRTTKPLVRFEEAIARSFHRLSSSLQSVLSSASNVVL